MQNVWSNGMRRIAVLGLVPFAVLSVASSEVSSTSTGFEDSFTLGEGGGSGGGGSNGAFQVEDDKFWGCFQITRVGPLPGAAATSLGGEEVRVSADWSFIGLTEPSEPVVFGDLEVSRAVDGNLRSLGRSLMTSAAAIPESENANGVTKYVGTTAVWSPAFADVEPSINRDKEEVYSGVFQIDGGIAVQALKDHFDAVGATVQFNMRVEHVVTTVVDEDEPADDEPAEDEPADDERQAKTPDEPAALVTTVHVRETDVVAEAENDLGYSVVVEPLVGPAAEAAGCLVRF